MRGNQLQQNIHNNTTSIKTHCGKNTHKNTSTQTRKQNAHGVEKHIMRPIRY